jgi:hypothetical protein
VTALVAACDQLVADLTAAGVRATLNRSQVNTPGAWVVPTAVEITTLGGGGTASVDVVLVVGDTGDRTALTQLDELLDKVLDLDLAFTAPVDTTYALVLTGPPLPAFRVPVALDL